jgi:hypothetical protein
LTRATLGKHDLYPYYDASILPPMADIGVNTAFALLMKGNRTQHGNRKGIEIKKFDGTTESLEYGDLFLRFRKREGFLVTRPRGNMVILKTKAAQSQPWRDSTVAPKQLPSGMEIKKCSKKSFITGGIWTS